MQIVSLQLEASPSQEISDFSIARQKLIASLGAGDGAPGPGPDIISTKATNLQGQSDINAISRNCKADLSDSAAGKKRAAKGSNVLTADSDVFLPRSNKNGAIAREVDARQKRFLKLPKRAHGILCRTQFITNI